MPSGYDITGDDMRFFLINNIKMKATVITEEKNWRHWICDTEIYFESGLTFMHFLRKIRVFT
jgi:hypothetical protein